MHVGRELRAVPANGQSRIGHCVLRGGEARKQVLEAVDPAVRRDRRTQGWLAAVARKVDRDVVDEDRPVQRPVASVDAGCISVAKIADFEKVVVARGHGWSPLCGRVERRVLSVVLGSVPTRVLAGSTCGSHVIQIRGVGS